MWLIVHFLDLMEVNTCYFEPVESDFKRIVSENLVRKYNALYNTDLEFDVGIEIESIGKFKMNLTYYKIFNKGASGRFLIKGNKFIAVSSRCRVRE